jgi:ketosteroid isomerase-like protein
MSQENVEIVRRVYEAAARRDDAATVLALYDPEVERDIPHSPARELVGRRVYHEHEGLRSFFREWYEAWGTVEPDLEELIDAGGHAISVETTRGRGRTSGAEVELPHYARKRERPECHGSWKAGHYCSAWKRHSLVREILRGRCRRRTWSLSRR